MYSIKSNIKKILDRLGRLVKIDMTYIVQGGTWLTVGNATSSSLLLLLSIVYANFLSQDTYGLFKYIQSVAAILAAFTLTGMNTAVTQAVARGYEGILKKSILIQMKWSIIYFLVCLTIGFYYLLQGQVQLGYSLLVISLLTPISLTFNTYIAFLNGKKDFKAISKYNFLSTLFVTLCTFLTILLTHEVFILVIVNAGANALANLAIYFKVVNLYSPNEQSDPQAISFGKHLSYMGIFGTISSQIDYLIIFHFLGATELSFFSFAVNIPDRLKGFTKILSNLAMPKFSQQTIDDLRKGILTKMPKFFLLLIIICILYIFFAPTLFNILFPKYQSSIPLTQLYSLSLIASATSIPVAALLTQRSKKNLYIFSTSSSVFQIVASLILIPFYGLFGAIIARLLSLFYNLTLSMVLLYKRQS